MPQKDVHNLDTIRGKLRSPHDLVKRFNLLNKEKGLIKYQSFSLLDIECKFSCCYIPSIRGAVQQSTLFFIVVKNTTFTVYIRLTVFSNGIYSIK